MTLTILFAYALLIAAGVANTLALYFFGYGIWPRDWFAVVFFGVIGNLLLRGAYERLEKERTK